VEEEQDGLVEALLGHASWYWRLSIRIDGVHANIDTIGLLKVNYAVQGHGKVGVFKLPLAHVIIPLVLLDSFRIFDREMARRDAAPQETLVVVVVLDVDNRFGLVNGQRQWLVRRSREWSKFQHMEVHIAQAVNVDIVVAVVDQTKLAVSMGGKVVSKLKDGVDYGAAEISVLLKRFFRFDIEAFELYDCKELYAFVLEERFGYNRIEKFVHLLLPLSKLQSAESEACRKLCGKRCALPAELGFHSLVSLLLNVCRVVRGYDVLPVRIKGGGCGSEAESCERRQLGLNQPGLDLALSLNVSFSLLEHDHNTIVFVSHCTVSLVLLPLRVSASAASWRKSVVLNGCIDRAEAKRGSEFSLIGRANGVDLPKHSALYITHTFLVQLVLERSG
jgi:hypothetical protein